jgi:glycerol-3-phosphate O-acyltransferase 3/4
VIVISFQSWNLLTRTSQTFEFVNVKLTVIWIIGFFVRYFCLLPGRVCILTVGVRFVKPFLQ